MIPRLAVFKTVAARLEGDSIDGGELVTVGRNTAPTNPPNTYAVLEAPPGSMRTGTLSTPERSMTLRLKVRTVATANPVEAATQEVERLSQVLEERLFDRTAPLTGDGWIVTGRELIGDSGIDTAGTSANRVIDVELYVAATAPAP